MRVLFQRYFSAKPSLRPRIEAFPVKLPKVELPQGSSGTRKPSNQSTSLSNTDAVPLPQIIRFPASSPSKNLHNEKSVHMHDAELLSVERPYSEWHKIAMKNPDRLLTRDFIHDSLYNQEDGYFTKRAVIFSPPEEIDFQSIADSDAFTERIHGLYKMYDEFNEDASLQVWHTPTELYKPWYGRALANYIVTEYQKMKDRNPGHPLIIYEMGAGNGTLMCNILDFIAENYPDIHASMQYNIIEISQQLTERQELNNMSRLHQEAQRHASVKIINKSVFDWNTFVPEECFFIALEDNFAHDAIRYNIAHDCPNETPLQTRVVVEDDTNEKIEEFLPIHDPLIQEYLSIREKAGYRTPLLKNRLARRIRSHLPFAPNVSPPEFLPTMQYYFLKKLLHFFPRHHLILSDFDSLPTPIEGIDAPKVQTRQRGTMIPCSTYLVTRGWFDIFFPTNFELMRDIYSVLLKNGIENQVHRNARVVKHSEFMQQYGNMERTTLRSGENPMVSHYGNVKFLLT